VTFTVLVEGVDPPFDEWVAAREFELVLLPGRRGLFGRARHPEAERLRAGSFAEVRVVDNKSGRLLGADGSSAPLPASR
jgi:hypothetical protein